MTGRKSEAELTGAPPPIVLAVDRLANPWAAVRWAGAEAVERGLPLRLVHFPVAATRRALQEDPALPGVTATIRAGARFVAAATVHAAATAADLEISSLLVVDPRPGQLAAAARTATMVVAGVAGDYSSAYAPLGRTGNALFTHSRGVLVAVPGQPCLKQTSPAYGHAPVVVGLTPVDTDAADNMVGFAFDQAAGWPHGHVVVAYSGDDAVAVEVSERWRNKYPEVRVTLRALDPGRSALLAASRGARLFVVGRRAGERRPGPATRLTLSSVTCPIALIRTDTVLP